MAVHLFTATGAGLAMLGFLAAVAGDWALMAIWLALAFVVDGIDGPLARRFSVSDHAPEIDGVILDLVIDFLTYVVIPIYAIYAAGLVPDWSGLMVLVGVPVASAVYFADTRMKTEDKSFLGFPGCWNMVAVVLLVLQPPPWIALAFVLVLTAALFLPIRFVHPVRTARWRPLTLSVSVVWVVAIVLAAIQDFDPGPVVSAIVGISTLYLCLAGALQQLLDDD
ncbi:MAG: CDP-alcohol phosphatidyltransferase family protein [Pseudomonadota bacterium]